MVLLAFRAPGNIEYRVAQIQSFLFREFSMVSAIALPPLVPLCFAETTEQAGIRLPPLCTRHVGTRYGTSSYFLEIRSLFLEISPSPACESNHPWEKKGLFPTATGFYLGEVPENQQDIVRLLPEAPKLTWSGGYLTCMELVVQAPLSTWWEYISWKVSSRKKL